MFDDKKEPEDIFAGTEPSQQPVQTPQKNSGMPPAPQPTMPPAMPVNGQVPPPLATELPQTKSSRSLVVVAVVIVILVVVLLVVLIGLWLVRSNQSTLPTDTDQPSITTQIEQNVPDTADADSGDAMEQDLDENGEAMEEDLTAEETVEDQINSLAPIEPVDTDGDGLTDEEEQALGTNPASPDTDNDGLNDAEEVRVWNTSPTNADTDGDTFSDGAEVESGYDPNQVGGVLLEVSPTIDPVSDLTTPPTTTETPTL
jgi:hypothetical protein